jgi:hypothetical protein
VPAATGGGVTVTGAFVPGCWVDMFGTRRVRGEPFGSEQRRGAAISGHHAVVLGEVRVRAAGGGVDVAQEDAQPARLVGDAGQGVVGAGELDRAADRDPLPVGTEHEGRAGTGAQVDELAVAPRATNATTGLPVSGCGSTPAWTTDTDGSASAWADSDGRRVTSTASQLSAAPTSWTRASPSVVIVRPGVSTVIGTPLDQDMCVRTLYCLRAHAHNRKRGRGRRVAVLMSIALCPCLSPLELQPG